MTQEDILPAGGQALIEGVLMRSPNNIAIAVRRPNKKIYVTTERVRQLSKIKVLNLPFIRGIANLCQMMYLGTKALNYSANMALDEEEESMHWSLVVGSIVLALGFGLFMFKFLPLIIAQGFAYVYPAIASNSIIFNAIDGV